MLRNNLLRSFLDFVFLSVMLCGVSGCEKSLLREHHDPFLKKSKLDYEQLTNPICLVPPPSLSQPPNLHKTTKQQLWPSSFEKKITVHFSQAIPLKDIFEAVAGQANVNLAFDPAFTQRKGFFYQAYQQPIKDIVKNICALAGVCYKIQNNTLVIQEDVPSLKTYFVPFLTGTRQNQNRISITTDVLNNTSEKGPASDNGSDTLLTSNSVTDFLGRAGTGFEANAYPFSRGDSKKGKRFQSSSTKLCPSQAGRYALCLRDPEPA